MNIYELLQDVNNGYDTYDSCIVVAESAEKARLIRPDCRKWENASPRTGWAFKPEQVTVNLIGTTDKYDEEQVILASFNA